MKHSFYCKKIGALSDELIKLLHDFCLTTSYHWKKGDDFSPNVIDSSPLPNNLLNLYFIEISKYFRLSGHCGTNIARMHPKSYLREHSDLNTVRGGDLSRFFKTIKFQIPIITDDRVLMIWTETIDKFHVEHCVSGGIYIFDNIVKHSVVNGSDNYRYNLTGRFEKSALINNDLLLDRQ